MALKDNTVELIEAYQKEYPLKIKRIIGGDGGGSSQSFMGMLKHVESPYCMFYDQDDYWEKDKIEISLNRIKELEKRPYVLMVYTDMEVVSDDLKPIWALFRPSKKLNLKWIKNSK